MIVAVDYFMKWVKAGALAKISVVNFFNLFKIHILIRYGIHQSIMIDNGTHFTNKNFKKLLEDLKVKQNFTLIEHPQTIGKAEAENSIMFRIEEEAQSS